MKPTLLTAALLALTATSAHAAPLELVKSLAERPMGFVVDDTCHVRGAVWAGGPRAGVNVALIDVVSAEVHQGTTNRDGVYTLAIPYSKPAVYQERLVDPVHVSASLAPHARLIEGGVVCDARLSLQLAPEANQ